MLEATTIIPPDGRSAEEHYAAIIGAAKALIPDGTDRIAAMANIASLLYYSLPNINWCGFYRNEGNKLVVGPFQGKPACIEIPFGRGVCGRAAAERRTILVENVDTFPDHIACDPASRSEIVVPLIEHGGVIGVLDLDSPMVGRFTQNDAQFLECIAQLVVERSQ